MLEVHQKGRAACRTGTARRWSATSRRMHAYGLWATMQKDDE